MFYNPLILCNIDKSSTIKNATSGYMPIDINEYILIRYKSVS